MASKISPFLSPGPVATADSLAIIHLKRDLQLPTILKAQDDDDEGYSEGKVVNTRFGSFPHTTLIGLPWGSQVRASKVDTGSRGRRGQGKDGVKKRKREDSAQTTPNKAPKLEADTPDTSTQSTTKGIEEKEQTEAVEALSGFIHLLPPTPENWTNSLPHRTQVVYTPDYSYILHRIRARPGINILEAGAGSGSFTHAAVRAVFSGYPSNGSPTSKRKGKVWSYEFHEQRHEKLHKEIVDHGLEDLVQITHRDVCEEGFLVDGKSPNVEAIFLDLPAPWLALPHLSRSQTPPHAVPVTNSNSKNGEAELKPFISPLNPSAPAHICTFSPCIEQVQRTVSAMRNLGWVDISMVELSQKRLEIRRERVGIDNEANHGTQLVPASVDEAVARLLEVEGNFKSFHETGEKKEKREKDNNPNSREKILESLVERKVYKEGALVHRSEPEMKIHTSYLVFAVLPRKWSDEDETKAREKWKVDAKVGDVKAEAPLSKKALKRAARQAHKDRAAAEVEEGGDDNSAEVAQDEDHVTANSDTPMVDAKDDEES